MPFVIVRPDGREESYRWTLTPPPPSPLGPIGVLDNSKPNAGALLEATRRRLVHRIGGEDGPVRRKAYPAMQAPPQIIAGLAAECAVVLVGSGD